MCFRGAVSLSKWKYSENIWKEKVSKLSPFWCPVMLFLPCVVVLLNRNSIGLFLIVFVVIFNIQFLKIILLLSSEWEAYLLKATKEKNCCYSWALLISFNLTGNTGHHCFAIGSVKIVVVKWIICVTKLTFVFISLGW